MTAYKVIMLFFSGQRKIIYFWFVLIILGQMFCSSVTAAGKTFYVSDTGNDSNIGSQSAPFKSFSKAVSVLAPGDILNVSGTFNTTLNVDISGTQVAPITILGSNAKINLNSTGLGNGIKISGNYIKVSGFDVSGTMSHAVLISGTGIVFENSSVHHSIKENGSVTCKGNVSWGSAIKLMIGSQNAIVKNNYVYENCGEGIGVTRSVNSKIEGNTVRDNFSVNIYIDNSPYSSAINNIVQCTGIYLRDGRRMAGIAIAEESYSGWGAQRHDNSAINNSVDGCYQGVASWTPEVSGGKFINGNISGNTITNGTNGSIVIRSVNQNVSITNNKIYKQIDVSNMSGVSLSNNLVIDGLKPTFTQKPSFTPLPSVVPKIGDVNRDGSVDIVDIGLIIDNYNTSPIANLKADINGDGKVNIIDIGIVVDNYAK